MTPRLVDPQIHRLHGYTLFDQHGLSPYWGFVSAFEPDHADELTFDALGGEWAVVGASVWQGKLAPPDSADFDGGLYEYKIQLEDQQTVDRDLTLTVRPGYPDATHVETGDSIGGLPEDCPESIRLEVDSTNLHPEDVLAVARAYFDAIGVNPDYLAGEPHEYSRIVALEVYVRLAREIYETKVVARGGVIEQLAQFAADGPLHGEHSWDHREVTGHHEETRLDADTWRRLLDRDVQELGYAVKGYHPDQVRSESTDPDEDPLRDPKVETAYRKKWSGETIPWREVERAIEETRTVLWNVLDWAGIDPAAERDVWTPDDYFAAGGVAVDDPEIVATPLDALAGAREEAVVDQLAATSLSDEQRRVLIALFDTESNHYKALADRADVGTSTIYRLLDSLSGLLTSMRGQIRFDDQVVRERVGGVVQRLRDMADWGRDRLQEAVDRVSAFQDGALQQWVERHGITITRDGDQLEFDLGDGLTRREAKQVLRSGGSKAQVDDDLDEETFKRSRVRFRAPDGVEWRGLVFGGGSFFHPFHT